MAQLGKVTFEPLAYNENNLTKVRFHDNGEDGEGIWIVVSDETKALLDKDTTGDEFVAMLANDALMFYPNTSWGLHILCKTCGENRAEADVNWVDYSIAENRVWSPDVKIEE